jgi:vacuolar iron transporter family protein
MSSKQDLQKAVQEHHESGAHGHALGPVIHDIVYGAHDGIITTFAVVAGTVGADLPVSIIIILGVANLLADGVSMGAGAFLSLRSENDQYKRLYKEELREIDEFPEREREEIRLAYAQKGFEGADLDRVVEVITSRKDVWAETMMREEHGLLAEESKEVVHGFATFLGFVVFGGVPLLPYFLGYASFGTAILASIGALVLVGITRSYVTQERLIRGALEIVSIGMLTGVIAYGVGVFLKGVVGVAL